MFSIFLQMFSMSFSTVSCGKKRRFGSNASSSSGGPCAAFTYLSRDVRSLVILYSFSQPHKATHNHRQLCHTVPFTRCILFTLLVIFVVSCSPYSSYPARLTRCIRFASLVVSCPLYSSYPVRLIRHIYPIASLAVTLVSMKLVGAYIFIDFLVV